MRLVNNLPWSRTWKSHGYFDTVRFPPPPWAATAFTAAAADGTLAYTPYRGHPGVLGQVARTLSPILGVPLSPAENIALTPGTQAGLFTTLAALVDDGDLVLVDERAVPRPGADRVRPRTRIRAR